MQTTWGPKPISQAQVLRGVRARKTANSRNRAGYDPEQKRQLAQCAGRRQAEQTRGTLVRLGFPRLVVAGPIPRPSPNGV
eukprot:1093455-Lingulodinium_polyedra.AAC.1